MGLLALYWAIRIAVLRGRIRDDRYHAHPDSYPDLTETPSVSLCVPARNEEAVIGDCVRTLLAQDYPAITQLVLVDDGSEDRTAELAREAAAGDERLQVVRGEGPPPGWIGKSAACWRAQQEATGEWLLFVDADVQLHPRAVSVAIGAARYYETHMLSWFGAMDTRSFWEHVLMPYIADVIVLFSPLSRVNDPGRDDCIANGQFLLIRRDAYDEVGGHETIKGSVVDDVSLSRTVKHHPPAGHLKHTMLQSKGLMSVRMYDSFGAIWRGFAKNFYAAGKGQVAGLIGLAGYMVATSVLPFVALPWLISVGDVGGAVMSGLAVLAILGLRFTARPYSPWPWWSALFQPLAALVTAGIVLRSVLAGVGILGGVSWKGRPT